MNFRAAATRHTESRRAKHCLRLALTYVELGERLASQTPIIAGSRFEEIQANRTGPLGELADFCGLLLERAPKQISRQY